MKFILDLYFKLFRAVFNKLPIFINKTKKNNWDWLKLDKNETFTKVLGALFFFGLYGVFLILFKFVLTQIIVPNIYFQLNFFGKSIVYYYKLFYNLLELLFFILWLVIMIVIIKNHNKKPNIRKIF